MVKIYKTTIQKFEYLAKWIFIPAIIIFAVTGSVKAQNVNVTATVGTAAATYNTLKKAFDEINAGTHQGVITIDIAISTDEGTTPAVLNSNTADPASYTSIYIKPSATNIVVTGNPAAGFGVIELNGADNVTIDGSFNGTSSRDLTINNTGTTTNLANSCIRVATSAVVNSADNLTIKNCIINGNVTSGNASGITNTNTSSNVSFGIYFGGNGGTTAIAAPTALPVDGTFAAAAIGVTINSLLVQNNLINQCGRGIMFNGADFSVSDDVTITGNIIGSSTALVFPYTAPATTVYSKGIWIAGTNALTINNNTVRAILSYLNTTLAGIEISANMGLGSLAITGNTVTGVANNNTTAGNASGVLLSSLAGAYSVAGNNVSVIESNANFQNVAGIQINSTGAAGTISENSVSKLFARAAGGAAVHGIQLQAAANGTTIKNNFIFDLMNIGTAFGNTRNVNGILISSGSNHKIYHNSVSLYGVSAATGTSSFNCLSINSSALTGLDIRNNIFSNKVTGGAANNVFTCLFMPFASLASMNLTLNNNAYYTGSEVGKSGIAFAGLGAYNVDSLFLVANFDATAVTPQLNWRSYSSDLGVGSNDNSSLASTAAAPFVSATDLHIPSNATVSQMESGGAVVGVLTDIDGDVRPGPAGSVNGGATLPDIGADEFDRAVDDKFPPVITSTLGVVCGQNFRTVTANIIDVTGVPVAGLGLPRLFWRINAGAWQAPVTGVHIGGTQYTFTFDNVATVGQTVEYYIVAQDLATIPNVGSSPDGGAGFTNTPPAAATPPATLFSYTVVANLPPGTYTVGTGAFDFPTITAAVNAYNTSCLSGPVVFNLMDLTSSVAEVYPITINANAFASAVNTLTIKPNSAGTSISAANGTALFKLNGADYIIFDGSRNGTNSRDLTISNTNAGTSATVMWIASSSTSNGATNNTIKNCILAGSQSNTSIACIIAGSGATLGNAAQAANSNNTITNNVLRAAQNGVFISGVTTGFDQNWLINNNVVGSTGVPNDKMGFRGMSVQGVQNFTISGNTIQGVICPTTTTSTSTGISVFTNSSNGNIYNNQISDIKHLNTGGWGSNGILLGTANAASNINVYNNFIWDVASYGGTGVTQGDNGYGMVLNNGGGYNIYYNSINMATNQTSSSSTTAAINIATGVTTTNSLNIRNNIFATSQTVGNVYAIYSAAAATVYSAIDYNDYHKGTSTRLGFLGTGRASLAEWRTATGKDANSVAVNPLFVSGVDLHLQLASPLNARAVSIGTITTDIDGNARNATTPDIGADEITPPNCAGLPTGGTASAVTTEICLSGSTYLSATGFTTGTEGLTYQWEVSLDNLVFNPMAGQTNPYSAFTGVINTPRWYRLRVTCAFGGTNTSNTVEVLVNNPSISTTNSGITRCGTGTVSLEAEDPAGNDVNWYTAATGGAPIGTGSPFTSPVISANTTFYVSSFVGGTTANLGAPNTGISGILNSQTTTTSGINFDVFSPTVTIVSVDIYPTAAIGSTFRIDVRQGTTVIASYIGTTTVSGTTTAPVAQTVPLGFVIPAGTGYRMTLPTNPGNIRNQGGDAFPYTAPGVMSLTSSTLSGFYYNFYNWVVTNSCESPRVPVLVNVTAPPAINAATATPATICDGQSSTLAVSSAYDPNYTYTWTPGALVGASVSVSPSTTTTYSVTALATGGPSAGCATTSSVTVTVNPSPTPLTISNDTTICSIGSATLVAASNVASEVRDYLYTYTTGATLDPMAGATVVVNSNVDDAPQATPSNIGFTFVFNNTNYTQFSASPDGWMLLGGATATNSFTNNVTLATNIPKIYPFWDDHATGSDGNVSYLLTGIAPNRILKVQWRVRMPRTPLTDPSNSLFQAWLYEGSNKIEFRYGAMNAAASTASVGLTAAPSTTNFQSVTVSTNTTSNTVANNTNAIQPAVGTMYTFIPPVPTFTWSPAAGLNTTSGPTVIATPATTTTYTATATNVIGCSRQDTVRVTVIPSTASVSIVANPTGAICAGTSVTFTATPVAGGTSPTYQWYVGATPVGANSPTYTTNTLANGDQVTVQMVSNEICVPATPVTSNAITMTVNPNLPVSVSIAASPAGPICSGTNVTFTATPTNGGAAPVYQWKLNGANVGINSPTYSNAALVTGDIVTCELTSNALCATGSPATSNQITMTVNPNVPVSVSIAAVPAGSICSGTSVTFTATPTNGGAAPVYQWQVNGGNVGINSPTYTSATLNNGDIVTCILTSNATCPSGNPATSNAITMTVTGSLAASVSIVSSGSLCAGSPVTFTATPVNGGTPSYQWVVNGGNVGPNSNVYTYVPANGDAVYVVMTSSLACAAPITSNSNTINITLTPSPTVTASADCNNILPGSGQQATLTAAATPPLPATITNYQWILNGVTNVGVNSPTYTTNVAGSYTVAVTNSNGCIDTSDVPVVITSVGGPLAGGTYLIPSSGCSGFDKISSAVAYINTWGIAGAVVFSITPAYAETAPVGGYALTATGTAVNTITFQRNGAGANPVITAGLQVAGTNNDGIFKIIGGDYITIQDLTLQENAGNTVTAAGATNTMTEWGIALLYANTTNGPNNNTIQNNTISLNRLYPNSYGIYSNMRHNATTPASGLDLTNTTGGQNKVYGNAVSNVNIPILFIGSGNGSILAPGNDIGGSAALTGNTLTNWGSATVPSGNGSFFGTTSTIAGIYSVNQSGVNISYNSITSAVGVNAGASGFRGIFNDFIGTAPSGTFTNTISNNTIALNSAGTTGSYEGIFQGNTVATAAVATMTVNITNNNISNVLTGAASASALAGINNIFPWGVLNISDNVIKGNTSTATTGGFTGISNSGAVATTININNNQIGDAGANAITFSAATNGAVIGIANTGGAAASSITITGNSLTKFVHTVTGTSIHTYLNNSVACTNLVVSNNTFSNLVTNSNGALNGITNNTVTATNKSFNANSFSNITAGTGQVTIMNVAGGTTGNTVSNNTISNIASGGSITGISISSTAGNSTVSNNTISGISSTAAGAPNLIGIQTQNATTITGNSISNISVGASGNSIVYGIFIATATSVTASQNTIHTLSGAGTGATTAINGIALLTSGNTYNINKNRIYNLSQSAATGTANPLVNGILISANNANTTANLNNNFISDLRTPVANIVDAIRAINITSTSATSAYNVYYNTIYLNATSSGTNFGSTGIFHTGNATATTATLTLRNNIIDNESVPNGTGRTVAFRRGSALANLVNYGSTSNNNSFYAGLASANNLVFFDGTNADQLITNFQTRVNTPARDAASVSVKPVFVNIAAAPYDLHLQTALSCSFDGQGNNAVILIPDDFDGDTRSTTNPFITDIGADEFTGTGGGIGVWAGVNNNWNDVQNWCGAIPSYTTNVTIPAAVANYPLITTATPVANNITIALGGSVTITGAGKLAIYGTITNAGTFNVVDGTIEMAGSTAQTIPAGAFQNNDLKNLVISNSAASPGVTLGGALNLYGKLSFTGSNRTFTTSGNLTLRSTASGTASVGDITNNSTVTGNTITGDVTVERFITARRAWRFLSVPTQNNLQTIKEAWQENMPANSTTQSTPPGYGIHITKDSANWAAYGFDLQTTPGPSMKYFVPASNIWRGVTSTVDVPGVNNGRFETGKGYMVLVRGDRTANLLGSPVTTTTLRDKGALVTGTYGPVAVGAGQFAAIGNPYASAVNFSKMGKSNLQDVYYLWDPYLGTLGGYVTFAGPGYNPTANVSYPTNKFIESGQAFFVRSNGPAGTLTITEPAKEDGSYLVTRPTGPVSQLRTNLYLVDTAGRHLYDGVLSEFDELYSNGIDGLDAEKMVNFGENLGIKAGDKVLSVERHARLKETDTIHYNLGQVRVRNYQLEFVAEGLDQSGLAAFLEDRYLDTKTPVSLTGTTVLDFNVINEPGSYAPDRFRLVFRQSAPVPVTFTSIRANKHDRSSILVEWKVENELNIHHYELERSGDGRTFSKVNEQVARGNGSGLPLVYNWLDVNPLEGDNFYRVRSVGIGSDSKLSQVVKVNMGKLPSEIAVYPNPVQEDGVVNISLQNKAAGDYQVSLVNSKGQVVLKQVLNHGGGSSVYSIRMEKYLSHGNYMLNITGDDNQKLAFKVVF